MGKERHHAGDDTARYEDHDELQRVAQDELRELGPKACAEAAGMSERRMRDVLEEREEESIELGAWRGPSTPQL